MYFLGGLGALLGPLFGVIMVDYWIIRKTKVNVPDLFTEEPTGEYHYQGGFNKRAIGALVPAAVIAILFAVLPAFSEVSRCSRGSSVQLSALVFYCRSRPAGWPTSAT